MLHFIKEHIWTFVFNCRKTIYLSLSSPVAMVTLMVNLETLVRIKNGISKHLIPLSHVHNNILFLFIFDCIKGIIYHLVRHFVIHHRILKQNLAKVLRLSTATYSEIRTLLTNGYYLTRLLCLSLLKCCIILIVVNLWQPERPLLSLLALNVQRIRYLEQVNILVVTSTKFAKTAHLSKSCGRCAVVQDWVQAHWFLLWGI